MKTVIVGAKALLPEGIRQCQIIVENGRILDVAEHVPFAPEDRVIRGSGLYLCPGFVDIHVHGGGGFSAMSGKAEDVIAMANAHARHGTTSILPTTLAAPIPILRAAVQGIRRAALSPVCPTEKGQCVIVDAGANNECTPEYLLQFAFMGSFYAEKYLGIENPRVGLLNNGAEEEKGPELQKQTHQLLKKAGESGHLNFIGNIEARDVPLGGADVVVCDGYTGNIMIKSIEGTAIFMAHQLKAMFQKNLGTKIGYLLCKSGVNDFKKVLDSREVGGSMFLGVQKPVVKAHGSSDDYAMMNAIRQAKICVETGVCDAIAANMDKMTIPKTADEA